GGLIVVDKATLETGMKGVYAGGDATDAPGTIIDAIAAGRKAASTIDRALGGSGDIEDVLFERGAPDQGLGRDEGFAAWPRERVPEIDMRIRHQGFQEVALGFSKEQATREASRCLQCDLRLFMKGNPFPPRKMLGFNEGNVNRVPEEEGVFQLYDENRNVLAVKGTANLRKELLGALGDVEKARWFDFEEDRMYSRRESELIQSYLRVHGRMPGSEDDDDILF
ncbi:MAG: BzdV protein, partial [Deltaproteobacteria bacterium]|nr:BzdV protein [Deltaproteobacteria bacterium]